jgi:hypothetical protein
MLSRGLGLVTSLVLATGLLVGVFSAPAQASPNGYSYQLSPCDPTTGRAPLTAFVTNNSGVTIARFGVVSSLPADGYTDGVAEAFDILPGETRPMPMNNVGGTVPGWHELSFEYYRSGAPDAVIPFYVPYEEGCSAMPPPVGDAPPPGVGPGDHGHHQAAKPKGLIHLANCQTGLIRGYVSTKGVLPKGKKTKFLTKVGQRKPVKFKRLNGVKKRKRLVFKHVPKRAVVVLKYKKGHKWIVLSKDGNVGCGGSR